MCLLYESNKTITLKLKCVELKSDCYHGLGIISQSALNDIKTDSDKHRLFHESFHTWRDDVYVQKHC